MEILGAVILRFGSQGLLVEGGVLERMQRSRAGRWGGGGGGWAVVVGRYEGVEIDALPKFLPLRLARGVPLVDLVDCDIRLVFLYVKTRDWIENVGSGVGARISTLGSVLGFGGGCWGGGGGGEGWGLVWVVG